MSTKNGKPTLKEIHGALYSKDLRYPMFQDFYGCEEDIANSPREENCGCDNCFYNRDFLALEILRLREVANESD